MNSNELIGEIPEELGLCRKLKCVSLQDNNLSGLVPDALVGCALVFIDIKKNAGLMITATVGDHKNSCQL